MFSCAPGREPAEDELAAWFPRLGAITARLHRGGELLLRDGEPVGFASSAAFGHSVGRAVLLGYVQRRDGAPADRDWLSQGRYQVAIGGELFEATASLRPPYDPSGVRIRS